MSLHAHYTSVLDKHSKHEGMITEETHRPSPDFGLVQSLKKQKLLLKEELERLRLLTSQRTDAA